eukprot:TRINITY_DN23657_c0_g1_i1.p3 TRINITY_DN23657_c0_g1~~TRINITY_DN23657_c0_g1_i1.p3  ORF type:complete len:170 (+),score=16.99 TRINITY_DN23657_c0_g1_i1:260-769(+)
MHIGRLFAQPESAQWIARHVDMSSGIMECLVDTLHKRVIKQYTKFVKRECHGINEEALVQYAKWRWGPGALNRRGEVVATLQPSGEFHAVGCMGTAPRAGAACSRCADARLVIWHAHHCWQTNGSHHTGSESQTRTRTSAACNARRASRGDPDAQSGAARSAGGCSAVQ